MPSRVGAVVNDLQVEAMVATLIDHIADMVVVVDVAGTIRYANVRTELVLGLGRADWIGRPVFEVLHPDDVPLGLELHVSAAARGLGLKEPVPFPALRGDGSWEATEVVAATIDVGDGSWPWRCRAGRSATGGPASTSSTMPPSGCRGCSPTPPSA